MKSSTRKLRSMVLVLPSRKAWIQDRGTWICLRQTQPDGAPPRFASVLNGSQSMVMKGLQV
eukprot:9172496-Heterocapsa_arctica.AAC.1